MNRTAGPRRPVLQISVRFLVILLTLVCVWMAFQVNRARRQRVAVDTLLKAGARVSFDLNWEAKWDAKGFPVDNPVLPAPSWLRRLVGNEYFDKVRSVSLPNTMNANITDATLANIRYLYDLKGVDLSQAAVSNAGLANLQHLTQIEGVNLPNDYPEAARNISDDGISRFAKLAKMHSLYLDHTGLTDNGLASLQGLTNLTALGLQDTKVTDEGLVYVGRMRKLRFLALWKTQTTDKGVSHLAQLVNLEQLILADTLVTDNCVKSLRHMAKLHNIALSGCNITDDALPVLYNLPSLRTVHLERTNVTSAGVASLRAAHPGCRVTH